MIDIVSVALSDMPNSESVYWVVSLLNGQRLTGKILTIENGIYAIGNPTTWYFRASQVAALGPEVVTSAIGR